MGALSFSVPPPAELLRRFRFHCRQFFGSAPLSRLFCPFSEVARNLPSWALRHAFLLKTGLCAVYNDAVRRWGIFCSHAHTCCSFLLVFFSPMKAQGFDGFFCFATFLFVFHRWSAIRPRAVRARRCAILEGAEPAEIRAISPRCVKTAEVRLIWQRCREPGEIQAKPAGFRRKRMLSERRKGH